MFTGGYANAQVYDQPGSEKVVNNTVVREIASTVAATLAGHLNAVSGFGGGGPGGVGVARADYVGTNGETGKAGAMNPRGFGLWFNGAYTSLSNDFTATAYDGDVITGMVGIDYRLNDRLTIGVAGGYETTDLDTTFNLGSYNQDGYSVTPYMVFRISRNFAVNAAGTYSWLSTDVSRTGGAVTGNFDSTRATGAVNLVGNWSAGKWRFGTILGYLYINQDDDGYVESTGAAIASTTTEIGQGRVGGRIGYNLGKVETYFSGRYEYDFTAPGSQTIVTTGGAVSTPNDRSGFTLAAGLRFQLAPNVSGGLEGTTTQGRDNQDIYGVNGTLRFEF